jgi:hypothetical protein
MIDQFFGCTQLPGTSSGFITPRFSGIECSDLFTTTTAISTASEVSTRLPDGRFAFEPLFRGSTPAFIHVKQYRIRPERALCVSRYEFCQTV